MPFPVYWISCYFKPPMKKNGPHRSVDAQVTVLRDDEWFDSLIKEIQKEIDKTPKSKKNKWRSIDEPFEPQAK